MKFKTERLEIKKPSDDDKQELIDELNCWEVCKFLTNVPYPYSIRDAEYWLKVTRESKFQSNIYLKKNLIGGIGFKQVKVNKYELGYWIAYKKWRNGYATEAVFGALSFLEKNNDCDIFANYLVGNAASANVLLKTGFRVFGKSDLFSISLNKKISCMKLKYHNEK